MMLKRINPLVFLTMAFLLLMGDVASTLVFMHFGFSEGNPNAVYLMQRFGVLEGMLIGKVFVLIPTVLLTYFIYWMNKPQTLARYRAKNKEREYEAGYMAIRLGFLFYIIQGAFVISYNLLTIIW